MPITKDRYLLNEDGSVPIKLLMRCIKEHRILTMQRYSKLDRYYKGEHKILNRTLSSDFLPNNKIVANHAEFITDMAVGYVFGTPVSYGGDSAEELNKIFIEIDEDSHNNELALDLSIFGVGYELIFMGDSETPYPELANLSPMNTFIVVDNTVKKEPMFGVNYYPKHDIDGLLKGYDVNVYTDKNVIHYSFNDLNNESPITIEIKHHYFEGIPLIEYKNNKKFAGDFEGVITLIDAYNLLQSDRVNDKEQMIDAILAVAGADLGDDFDEKAETGKLLKELKILELQPGGDAKWLVKTLNETETEVLKNSLKDDIHEFSKVPCLTDENFAGNSSGVAMKYKLLAFEQLGKTKERYFKQGLRKRLKLISNIENMRERNIDPSLIDITMKRTLPIDDELLARIAQETEGFISWETRVKRFDEEIDIEEERKRLEEEKKNNIEEQQRMFGSYDFKSTGGEVDEEEK